MTLLDALKTILIELKKMYTHRIHFGFGQFPLPQREAGSPWSRCVSSEQKLAILKDNNPDLRQIPIFFRTSLPGGFSAAAARHF